MKKTFESELPRGYRQVFAVDATDKKLGLFLNGAALIILFAVIVPAFLAIGPKLEDYRLFSSLVLVVAMFAYIVLHELTHGVAYKLLTHQKLTFGMTLSVAYCGVPNIFVYRSTALISLLAPFVVFIPVFALPMLLLENTVDQMYCAVLLGMHLGGCAGDLWDTWLFLTKFKDPAVLMNDTGPKQTFYLPEK